MRLIVLLCSLLDPAAAAPAPECPGVLHIDETHSNSWKWTRDSFSAMKNTVAEVHPWEWIYQAPLTILATPGDLLAMPFRRGGVFLRGSLQGAVEDADGRPLANFPWKAWPWKYQDHPGKKAFKGFVRSFSRPCTKKKPCDADDAQSDQFEFGTDSAGSFVFTFEGFIVRGGYMEVAFDAPLDRTIRIQRDGKGKIVAVDAASGSELCTLALRAAPATATPPSK